MQRRQKNLNDKKEGLSASEKSGITLAIFVALVFGFYMFLQDMKDSKVEAKCEGAKELSVYWDAYHNSTCEASCASSAVTHSQMKERPKTINDVPKEIRKYCKDLCERYSEYTAEKVIKQFDGMGCLNESE